jgi:hypothetical protein
LVAALPDPSGGLAAALYLLATAATYRALGLLRASPAPALAARAEEAA